MHVTFDSLFKLFSILLWLLSKMTYRTFMLWIRGLCQNNLLLVSKSSWLGVHLIILLLFLGLLKLQMLGWFFDFIYCVNLLLVFDISYMDRWLRTSVWSERGFLLWSPLEIIFHNWLFLLVILAWLGLYLCVLSVSVHTIVISKIGSINQELC